MCSEEILNIPVEELIPCVVQSRERFDEAELLALSEDIKAKGLLQAGVAWFDPGRGKHVLVCGERRWRAIKMAGLPTMAVRVVQGNLTLGDMLALNLSENLQRASLNPIERARAFRRLAQLEGINGRQVAERMHVSSATVSRDLALLDLPEDLQSRIASGGISASIGYELSRLAEHPQAQQELAAAIAAGQVGRDAVAEAVRRRIRPRTATPRPSRLAFKLGGLSVSITAGQPDKLSLDNLVTVLGRVSREAKTLKDGGKTGLAELAQVLKAS
jgi:ParB family transcriptional regulator, chromosome partitioning protein